MNPFNPATCVCLSQVTTCIFIGICRAIFLYWSIRNQIQTHNYHKITATMAPDQYTISFSLKLPHKMELNFTWMTILRRSSTKIPHFILIGQKSCMVAIGNSGFWLTNIKELPYICQWKQHYVMFVSYLWQIGGFLRVLQFQPRYNWNIVESGFKHHQTSNLIWFDLLCLMPLSAIFQLYQVLFKISICNFEEDKYHGRNRHSCFWLINIHVCLFEGPGGSMS
jgi:hypothetical protein